MSGDRYQPELGQASFGQPWGEYDLGELGSACVAAVLDEMRRVFWNREGREISYQSEADAETWNAYGSGIEWHAYWWGDDESSAASRPNLSFDDRHIRWYKYPGRGESIGDEMSPADWSTWLSLALAEARRMDTRA